jgi:drug/metabolite transporter (DMT)-like permease
MALHQPSGRWRLGLALALITAGFWATLPVALKLALEALDPITLTWARFAIATVVVGLWLGWRGGFAGYRGHGLGIWMMLLVAALMLIGNYVLYLLGLAYTTPANAQLLIQAAPLLMALGGIWIFRERFSRGQWFGLAAVAGGLALFFLDQRRVAAEAMSYLIGSALVLLGALVWAVYALLQKQLLQRFSSLAVLWIVYVVATLTLLPFSNPRSVLALDPLHALAFAYCALNTLGAYGAFAEALAHWEASRVSVVLALTPILTVLTVELVHLIWPGLIAPERIALAGWCGAAMVLTGSVMVSVLRAR